MKILIVNNTKLPAVKYGGTERVIWGLGKALNDLGHEIFYLVAKGSYCPFAKAIYEYDEAKSLNEQIPEHIDVVHLNFQTEEKLSKPCITTFHGNVSHEYTFQLNTVFISYNQAKRFHGNTFVYNGLDWDDYPNPDLNNTRNYFHFLGDAAWKVKNVKGAINITKEAGEKLYILGGKRFNTNMGIRFYTDLHARFKGMVDNTLKAKYMQHSKGLIFPVLWHEPFGLAIIESMYFGCPVFGTTYGSLPELVTNETGFLSNSITSLVYAVKNADTYNKTLCHAHVTDHFSSTVMAKNYIKLYEKVLNNETIHTIAPFFSKDDEAGAGKRFVMGK
jgi:glycosyltransferase involved in cell wall biosynthesis